MSAPGKAGAILPVEVRPSREAYIAIAWGVGLATKDQTSQAPAQHLLALEPARVSQALERIRQLVLGIGRHTRC